MMKISIFCDVNSLILRKIDKWYVKKIKKERMKKWIFIEFYLFLLGKINILVEKRKCI